MLTGCQLPTSFIIRILGKDLCLGLSIQVGLLWGRRPTAQLAMKCMGCSVITL